MEKAPKKKLKMQERGYKALTTFVKENVYHALRRHAVDLKISHSKYLAQLAEGDLRKKGYLDPLPFPVATQARAKRGG